MKKIKYFLAAALAMVFAAPVVAQSKVDVNASAEEAYTETIAAENNLAVSKYDWLTDKVGAGNPEVSETGIRLENFTTGNSVYALYQTNSFSNFEYTMHAKLNLVRPDQVPGFEASDAFSYSNLYISFMINTNGGEPAAAYACPWNGNKAYFSVCFETLCDENGNAATLTQLYLNQSYMGDGSKRATVADSRTVNWNDGEYHWYKFTIENYEEEGTYRNQPTTFTGKHFKMYFDGELVLEHKQRDQYVSYVDSTGADAVYENANFSNTSGYLGLWPSSNFPANALVENTDCYVHIDQLQITSWDNAEKVPYTQCPTPDFPLTTKVFSPAASYETGEPIEIKLSDLFSYEGDEKLTYTVTCDGQSVGKINNGYWVWTPEAAGNYYIDVKATVGEKEAINYITLYAVDSASPTPTTSETSDDAADTTSEEKKGCSGAVGSALFAVLPAVGMCLLRKKEEK